MKVSICILLAHLYLVLSSADSAELEKSANVGENTAFIDEFSSILRVKLYKTFLPHASYVHRSASPSLFNGEASTSVISTSSAKRKSSKAGVLQGTSTPLVDNDGINENSKKSNSTFVPFDEWKMNNLDDKPLKKQTRVRSSSRMDQTEGDTIGDDLEIDIGFLSSSDVEKVHEDQNEEPEGKVYKHKFNFASLDCAATIVKTNSEASGASSILIENKDKYLLNPCSAASQFITVELCQDILVEEIVLANFEYFSSTFKKLRFSVSDQYPVGKNGWRMIGEFEAEDSRNLQIFYIDNPQIWARYLQVEVLSHHDEEYYCPISILRVHGKTMMDDFKMENSKSNPPVVVTVEEELKKEILDECMETVVEQCDLWPSINPANITLVPHFPDYFKTCSSKLKTLKFDEFLRELNESSCLPSYSKDSVNNEGSSSSSASQTNSFSTEESIFKNIMKRLSSLESNTSLTVQYIEEQGRLLSNSFEQLERAQTIKFENMIGLFNQTIMDNLNALRVFAKQLKDQSVRILEEQKLNTDQFTTKNMNRLEILEEQLKVQKIFAYALLISVLLIFAYLFVNKEDSFSMNHLERTMPSV
ncbi:hypothetical protein HG535_0A00940 [Zygotorulaspora mrakii]|uniref:SUN-like protein 1 n=1 Tax=Zygotorulaspora mrakii TaxID=42260 RepID=A0A7H9AV52_ZYGMR|nr:uncharacterized protein HG535_0A00940 [Zygotorulaspora mrakii]QLG70155.1 hypothetical protein HG535_0A00940 [Zygotorulaspora mrakii]